jgi:hypothetical protein
MTTSVTNTIIIIDNEGDSSSAAQTTVVSNIINLIAQTPASITRIIVDPVLITRTNIVVPITRKTIDPVIITIPS